MTIDVSKIKPGALYQDGEDNVWRVTGICHEPYVIMEEVGRQDVRKSGGCHGFMWDGFRRLVPEGDAP